MEKFQRLTSGAIPILEENIDTDIIYPARYLLVMEKKGLGEFLFHDRRFSRSGETRPDSILDKPEFAGRSILVAGDNFGCGSSREQAVWALADYGIKCVIAPSLGEIFYSNCFKSGVLPIIIPRDIVLGFAAEAASDTIFDVDLETQTIEAGSGAAVPFSIDADRRLALLRGWDEIDTILNEELANIECFERGHRAVQPWLF